MLVVVALGNNAFLLREDPVDANVQRHNVKAAVRAVARLAQSHDIVVTHGNGPQLSQLALQEEALSATTSSPVDVLDAESEGMIGYLLDQALANELPERHVATLLTQVVVDADDPAFLSPSQPVGPLYTEAKARQLAIARRWAMGRTGDHFRRRVPSPEPRRLIELETIRLLVEAGTIVICAGGGGIPVVLDGDGALRGVEAKVDKDLAAALLAAELHADALLLLTDVPAVYTGWPAPPHSRPLDETTPAELRAISFAAGSMGPKVEAACRFVETTGNLAGIGALSDASAILAGQLGTRIRRDGTQ